MIVARDLTRCIPVLLAMGCFDFLDKSDDDEWGEETADGEGSATAGSATGSGGGEGDSTTDAGATADDSGSPTADEPGLDTGDEGNVIRMPGDDCASGTGVLDCDLECWNGMARSYLGDGFCDDGFRGPNFNCIELTEDEGDCVEDTGDATGGDTDGETGEEEFRDSCTFGESICVEPNESDNESWCSSLGSWAEYFGEPCPDGAVGTCAIPVGDDYSAPATGYYYGDFDGVSACTSSGGTYTAIDGVEESGDTGEI